MIQSIHRIIGLSPFESPDVELIVTNACHDHVGSPSDHGTPDPAWLRENLTLLEPFKVVLLCGRVAETAYTASGYLLPSASRLIRMPHPAARFWTTGMVATYARLIQDAL